MNGHAKTGSGARQRGITLLEGLFYLALASSVIGFSTSFILQEQRRQEDIQVARELALVLQGAQTFVSVEYDEILDELFNEAAISGEAIIRYSIADMADRGFLPSVFLQGEDVATQGALGRLYGQEFSLLARAVMAGDTAIPKATASIGEMDPLSQGSVSAAIQEDLFIEAIVVSSGGSAIPRQRGAPVTVRTERSNAGFIEEANEARGPYGVYSFDLSGFQPLADVYPEPGRFASIVAISDFGVLGAGGLTDDGDDGGFTIPNPLELEGDLVFINTDTTGDGLLDTFPAIRQLNKISMLEPTDSTGDGEPDVFSVIENLNRISCGSADGLQGSANALVIDCPQTRLTGDLIVEGTVLDGLTIEGGLNLTDGNTERQIADMEDVLGEAETRLFADRLIFESLDDVDASTAAYDFRILESGDTIAKPSCPDTTFDEQFQVEPRIYVVPASFADPDGRATVGVRAFAQDEGNAWRVRMFQFVGEDRCTFSLSTGDPDQAPGICENPNDPSDPDGNPDGNSDVYQIDGEFGRVLAMTRCF